MMMSRSTFVAVLLSLTVIVAVIIGWRASRQNVELIALQRHGNANFGHVQPKHLLDIKRVFSGLRQSNSLQHSLGKIIDRLLKFRSKMAYSRTGQSLHGDEVSL
jgi:hypothetical protein